MLQETKISSEDQQILYYYKDKVSNLERQREAWLGKFDECQSKLQIKHDKQLELRMLKDSIGDKQKNIIHHSIAEIEEQLSSIQIDRQNQNLQLQQAQQFVKMRKMPKNHPITLEKQLPCLNAFKGKNIIQNDLNLHKSQRQQKKYQKIDQSRSSTKASKPKIQKQNSHEDILSLRLIENRKFNEQQISLLQNQKSLLLHSIINFKVHEQDKLNKERNIAKNFQIKYKQLELKHKELSETYFQFRRNHKTKFQNTVKENTDIKDKYVIFEKKLESQNRVYEKQIKVKKALMQKKSADFNQNYKAKMRAKQRNLLTLKENYEKMQEVCIKKVRKLEATLEKAHYSLKDSDEKRKFIVEELREELQNLYKKNSQIVVEKTRLNIRLKNKLQKQKIEQEQRIQKNEINHRLIERDELLKSAYKKTRLPSEKKNHPNKKGFRKNNFQSESQNDSLNMSDLEKIQSQINHLQNKIVCDDEEQN